jgi:hypothetical protein
VPVPLFPPAGLAPPLGVVVVGVVVVVAEAVVVALDGVVTAAGVVVVEELVEVVELVVDVVVVTEAIGVAFVGIVRVGAPAESVAELELPHAASPAASSAPAITAAKGVANRRIGRRLGTERFHTPAAGGAVVEVLLGKLVAPVAEAEVLHRPRQLGRRGSKGQHRGHHLELLARIAVEILVVGLGLDDCFMPR